MAGRGTGGRTREGEEEGEFGRGPDEHRVGTREGADDGADPGRLDVLVRKLESCEGHVQVTLYAGEEVVDCDVTNSPTSETAYVTQESPEERAGSGDRLACWLQRSIARFALG